MYRFITGGIYYLLSKAYPPNKFEQLFGYIFEEYTNDLLREFLCESDVLVRTLCVSPRFVGKNDQVCDGILLHDNRAFIMEYKASVLTTRQRFGGDRDVTMTEVDAI